MDFSRYTNGTAFRPEEENFLRQISKKLKEDVGITNYISPVDYNSNNGTHYINIEGKGWRNVIEIMCNHKKDLRVRSTLTSKWYPIDNFNHLVNVLLAHKEIFDNDNLTRMKPYVRKKRLLEFLKED